MQKKLKNFKFLKKIFFARNNLKCLKICWKNFFSLETTLNALKFVRNTICAVHDKFQAGISQKSS